MNASSLKLVSVWHVEDRSNILGGLKFSAKASKLE